MGSKSSAPPAPDYAAAAKEQGQANVDAARLSGRMSNPNFTNPLGQRTVTYGGQAQLPGWADRADANAEVERRVREFGHSRAQAVGDVQAGWGLSQPGVYTGYDADQVNVVDTLTPEGKSRFDQEQRIITSLGNTAEAGLGRVADSFAKPFDFASAADARQQSQDALSARLEPKLNQDREALRTQLINSGFRTGTEGFDRAMKRADEQATDARLQVINQAGGEQDRMVQLASMLRNQPLNELNALRTGSQVSLPQFQAFQGKDVAAAPIFGATQAQGAYDMNAANMAAQQKMAFQKGLFDLGAAGIGAFG
jgi:hypothetical protein